MDVDSAENMVLLVKQAEKKLDEFRITFIPCATDANMIRVGPMHVIWMHARAHVLTAQQFVIIEFCCFSTTLDQVCVLDPRLKSTSHNFIMDHCATWDQLGGATLRFDTPQRPSASVCMFHARLAIRHAESRGWIPKGSVVVPKAPQMHCDEKLLRQFLMDAEASSSGSSSGMPSQSTSQ